MSVGRIKVLRLKNSAGVIKDVKVGFSWTLEKGYLPEDEVVESTLKSKGIIAA